LTSLVNSELQKAHDLKTTTTISDIQTVLEGNQGIVRKQSFMSQRKGERCGHDAKQAFVILAEDVR